MNRHLTIYLIIILVGLFYILTICDGHNWGGDFSMYISHAKNIATAKDYEDTGYIYNPSYPSLAPKTYPPIYPLVLSPVYWLFGLNFKVMKLENIFIFLLALFVIFLNFKDTLSSENLTLLISILGFNFYFWDFKENVVSDILFLLFVYTSLYFIKKRYRFYRESKRAVIFSIFSAIFIYMAYGTRSVGLIFWPAIFIYEFIKYRKLSIITFFAFIIFLTPALLQNFIIHNDSSYFDLFALNGIHILNNFVEYFKRAYHFWDNGNFLSLKISIFFIISVGSFLGFILNYKKSPTIYEIFLLTYLSVIIVFPYNQGTRYLIPILPLYIYYFFVFMKNINQGRYSKIALILSFALMSSIFVSYFLKYVNHGFKPLLEGIHKTESVELFNFIKTETDKSDVIIFPKPRVLALFSDRGSASLHIANNDVELWQFLKKIGAKYIIKTDIWKDELERYYIFFIQRNREKLELVFSNDDFQIYMIKKYKDYEP